MLFSLLTIFGFTSLFLSFYSIPQIKKSKKECNFIWAWAFPLGAFVWEDLLVFGLLHAGIAFFSVYFQNLFIWVIGFLVFWIVRSAGETLYFFLQQFIEPKQHPHRISAHFKLIRKLLGNISDQKCFILMQVLMQAVLTISCILLIYTLKIAF